MNIKGNSSLNKLYIYKWGLRGIFLMLGAKVKRFKEHSLLLMFCEGSLRAIFSQLSFREYQIQTMFRGEKCFLLTWVVCYFILSQAPSDLQWVSTKNSPCNHHEMRTEWASQEDPGRLRKLYVPCGFCFSHWRNLRLRGALCWYEGLFGPNIATPPILLTLPGSGNFTVVSCLWIVASLVFW